MLWPSNLQNPLSMYLLSTKLDYSIITCLNLDFDMLKCSESVFVYSIIL